jgi:hypothetical protein
MTEQCDCVCENAKECSIVFSIYSGKCPCNNCIVNLMCKVSCKAHMDFRLFVLKTNAINDEYELYKITKKHQSRF